MKLVGEYEITDNGVLIEGQIKDSHIHDVRSLLKPIGEIRLYHGEKPKGYSSGERPNAYLVPHHGYRGYILRHVPDVITPDVDREYVPIRKGLKVDDSFAIYYRDGSTFSANMGVIYEDGDGRTIMDERVYTSLQSMKRQKSRFMTNSAWVWNVAKDGSFRVELHGLVNRHIMTVVLENATKLAKYIDNVLVKTLDHPKVFTSEKVIADGRQLAQRFW